MNIKVCYQKETDVRKSRLYLFPVGINASLDLGCVGSSLGLLALLWVVADVGGVLRVCIGKTFLLSTLAVLSTWGLGRGTLVMSILARQ